MGIKHSVSYQSGENVAKNIVAAGLAHKVEVQVAYAIGVADERREPEDRKRFSARRVARRRKTPPICGPSGSHRRARGRRDRLQRQRGRQSRGHHPAWRRPFQPDLDVRSSQNPIAEGDF